MHINIFGQYDMLPKASIDAIDKMVGRLADNDGLVFNIALNYGGRDEILRSVKELCRECAEEGRDPAELTEDDISKHLYSGSAHFDVPDPDLIIRTSGEERLSNFMLWQGAYSEFVFTDVLWPDFTTDMLDEAIVEYNKRNRRFGGR